MYKWLPYRRTLPFALALIAGLLGLGLWLAPRATGALQPDPVREAWEKAHATGSYQFSSDVTQMTMPVAKVTNVGRTSRTEQIHLRGETDLRQSRLQMQLWSDGGSVAQGEGGIAIKVEEGKSYIRHGAPNGHPEWQESEGVVDGLAPQGDFLAYLQAVREVKANSPESRAGITFTRYTFRLDGPTFAAYVRNQMEAALRAKGELPPGVSLQSPTYYRDMTGDGELWVSEDGLPLRQILRLNFPEQRDATTHAQIVVDFTRFGQASALTSHSSSVTGGWVWGDWQVVVQAGAPWIALLAMGVLVAIMVFYRRARVVQAALASAVITSLVAGPLLTTFKVDSFFAAQAAKAAAQEEQQAAADAGRGLSEALGAVAFNPHVNPLESADLESLELADLLTVSPIKSPQSLNLQSPNLQLTDGVDSDGDGLSDFVEERVGTDPANPDSDEDGLNDALEVKGFQFAGKTWYLNPLEPDSNNDGIADGLEWDNDGNGQPDDTDGDGIPDVFDPDNDGDGVPDRLDLAPFTVSTAVYSGATPLQLTVNNLTAGKPTFVDFQVRPTAANHLWYAFNVLDWPHNDSQSQMQDIDGKNFADLAAAQGRNAAANEAHGDMKLIPMLEIRISGTTTNLPPQSDLTPYKHQRQQPDGGWQPEGHLCAVEPGRRRADRPARGL